MPVEQEARQAPQGKAAVTRWFPGRQAPVCLPSWSCKLSLNLWNSSRRKNTQRRLKNMGWVRYNHFSTLCWVRKKRELFWKIFLTDVSIEFWPFAHSFIKTNLFIYLGPGKEKGNSLELSSINPWKSFHFIKCRWPHILKRNLFSTLIICIPSLNSFE